MKKRSKIKKTLVMALAMCLTFTYFPLQASAEDQETVITSQDEWNSLESKVTPGTWPGEITINADGNSIATDIYVQSNINFTSGTFTVKNNVSGTVAVSGGKFIYDGTGNPLSDVTVTGGKFTNNHTVTSATVSGGEYINSTGHTTNGLTLSDGTFTNDGTLSGTATINGGTLENNSEINVPIAMTKGTLTNKGSIADLELSGGIVEIKDGSRIGNITMSDGTLRYTSNEIGAFANFIINGAQCKVNAGASLTVADILPAPKDPKWQEDDTHKKAVAEWTASEGADSYTLSLYRSGTNSPVFTDTTATTDSTTYDFTNQIIENNYGDYHFTVQAKAEKKISSSIAKGPDFQYTAPSNGAVDNNDYAWDNSTGTLTIKTYNGCLAWKKDTQILGSLITSSSYETVRHAVIGPKVAALESSMLPCPKLEDVVIQPNRAQFPIMSDWANGIPGTATAYAVSPGLLSFFPGHQIVTPCPIIGIKDNQVFKGSAPQQFTLYSMGSVAVTVSGASYTSPLSWQITKAGEGQISSGTFQENNENVHTVNDLKLADAGYGTYTLVIDYQVKTRDNNSDWTDNGEPATKSITFTIAPESDPEPVYPPSPSQYTITSSAEPGGTITPLGSTTVYAGGDASYKIQAAEGYILKDVLVDEKSVGPLTQYTFERVYANHSIHAVFEKDDSQEDPEDPNRPDKPVGPTDSDNPTGTKKDPVQKPKDPASPRTADESHLYFWIVLAGAAGTAAMRFKRNHR